jgi:hypothetical protein
MSQDREKFLQELSNVISEARVEYELEFKDSDMPEDEFVGLAVMAFVHKNEKQLPPPIVPADGRKHMGVSTLRLRHDDVVDSTGADKEVNRFLYDLDAYAQKNGGKLPVFIDHHQRTMRQMVYNMIGAIRTKASKRP